MIKSLFSLILVISSAAMSDQSTQLVPVEYNKPFEALDFQATTIQCLAGFIKASSDINSIFHTEKYSLKHSIIEGWRIYQNKVSNPGSSDIMVLHAILGNLSQARAYLYNNSISKDEWIAIFDSKFMNGTPFTQLDPVTTPYALTNKAMKQLTPYGFDKNMLKSTSHEDKTQIFAIIQKATADKVLAENEVIGVGLPRCVTNEVTVVDVPETITTNTGAIFTLDKSNPKFGIAYREPNKKNGKRGLIWAGYKSGYANDLKKADEVCAKVGGRVPTAYEFQNLSKLLGKDLPTDNLGNKGYPYRTGTQTPVLGDLSWATYITKVDRKAVNSLCETAYFDFTLATLYFPGCEFFGRKNKDPISVRCVK